MPKIYLKKNQTVEVPLKTLKDYLYNNQDKIETRHKQVKRPPAV